MDDAPTRYVEIELGGQEVITVDLDNLDPNPEDVLDLLRDGQCKVWVWTKLAAEYWRRGYLEAAERIANAAIESFKSTGTTSSLPPLYSLLANLQMARARTAPKLVLSTAREDIMLKEKPKEDHYREAAHLLNAAQSAGLEAGETPGDALSFLTRGVHQLATRSMEDALRSFEGVLVQTPTNLVALLGKARILYACRSFPQALQTFQLVLRYNPHCQPDPRIGIGLCFWALDQKATAKAAWQRSLELNPNEPAAQLLLGLEAVNSSKNEHLPEAERTQSFVYGTKLLEKAFKANQKSAAAANALCELLLLKGNFQRALKLAERTIQFADTLTVLTDGYIRAARALHAERGPGSLSQATKYYSTALEGQPKNVVAGVGLAQMQMQNEEMAGAIHTLDTLVQPLNPQKCPEATVMLASLRAFPRPGISSWDLAKERIRSRELFERVVKDLEIDDAHLNGHSSRRSRIIGEDVQMHVDIAKLWQTDNLDRTKKAYREALRISEAQGDVDPKLLNNVGVMMHLEDNLTEARGFYEGALTKASGVSSEGGEGMSTSILYNLARVYEDQGEDSMAKDAYEKLLTRHPEYVDAKIRQAHMLAKVNRNNEAHELLKQSLTSQNSNLNLRAFYTHFLIQTNAPKPAKDFVFSTLKDHDKHDVYSLCAAGWIMYHQSRESRDMSSKGMEERRRGFQRSAEFYEKALQLDGSCAVAAQGLAIVTAEDSLAIGVPAGGADEAQRRFKNAREALDVFAKVRESLNDGSVYSNMGHCYYLRDEFDRAIESYETASARFYGNHNVPVLMCLCRSWYAKATKDQSYVAMKTALKYAQMALHIQPSDKAILYNIAMIQQKSAEMLFSLPPPKRTLKDLQRVLDQAHHAQRLFASLAGDKSPMVPYNREIADQRRKYGDNMLRKGDEHLATQRQYEAESQAKLDAARQKRQEERERIEALERERAEVLRREAEKLAEERRIAREQAQAWSREVRIESDEEKEKRPKRSKKQRAEGEEGEEASAPKRSRRQKGDDDNGEEGAEPKKRRRGKLRKNNNEQGEGEADGEEQATFTDEEGAEKPKRRARKRVVRDDDEDDGGGGAIGGPRKKQYKSKEVLSDTEDEMV